MRFLFIIVALLQPAAILAQSTSLGIDAGAGVQIVEVERSRGNAVFSLSALQPLGARVTSDARAAKLSLFGDTISFEFGSPFFRHQGKVYQLVTPTLRTPAATVVPTQFLTEWLPARFPDKLAIKDGVLRLKQPAPMPAPTPGPAPAPESVRRPPESAKPPANRVIIIDPGHGGRDPGKTGPNGLAEKNVVLTVATRLAAQLRERGYEVHLTRTADTLIALADRPRLANLWKNGRPAALFVSIHANSGVASAEGFETYFLSEARTDDERRVAAMENAAVSFEEKSSTPAPGIEQLLSGLRNDYYQRASHDFAQVIQRELAVFHSGPNRGVKQAGFRVLVGALMPAVLVELAFISNPTEARLLGTAAFQEKLAFGLARSIASFFESHQHLWVTSGEGQP